jgi:hypothetical protein
MIDEVMVNALGVVCAFMFSDNGLTNVGEDGIVESDVHEDLLAIKFLTCIQSCEKVVL